MVMVDDGELLRLSLSVWVRVPDPVKVSVSVMMGVSDCVAVCVRVTSAVPVYVSDFSRADTVNVSVQLSLRVISTVVDTDGLTVLLAVSVRVSDIESEVVGFTVSEKVWVLEGDSDIVGSSVMDVLRERRLIVNDRVLERLRDIVDDIDSVVVRLTDSLMDCESVSVCDDESDTEPDTGADGVIGML